MKNNKFQILLFIIVAFIWYKAFGRIWGNLSTEKKFLNTESDEVDFKDVKRDSFSLKLDYSDPFEISLNESKNKLSSVVESKVPSKELLDKHSIDWPIIEYRGLVLRQGAKSPLIILKVDQQDVIMRLGEKTFGGIHLVYANREYIELKYLDSKRKFWRD